MRRRCCRPPSLTAAPGRREAQATFAPAHADARGLSATLRHASQAAATASLGGLSEPNQAATTHPRELSEPNQAATNHPRELSEPNQAATNHPRELSEPNQATATGSKKPLAPTPKTPPRRHLALHFPFLPTEHRRLAGLAACWTTTGNRRHLTAVTPDAAALGLAPGQPLADAQAIQPSLTLHPDDPVADAACLERLALWSLRFTPLAAIDAPDGLLLDIAGLAHLYGGEPALLATIAARFAAAGLTTSAAIADSPTAAAALARTADPLQTTAHIVPIIIPAGADRAAVAPLPLDALRLDAALIARLSRIGLRRVDDLLRQPRGPLARRFGRALLATLDAATGTSTTPITPVRPPPERAVAHDFLEPITTREAIDATLARLLHRLCATLERQGQGASRLELAAFRVDGMTQRIAIGTGLPAREPRHFARLFRDRLEALEPGFGFDRLALEAPLAEPMPGTQNNLPGRDGMAIEDRRQALAQLLDRLGQRLPIWRPAPRASHWPERAIARSNAFATFTTPPGWPGLAPRPVRLLRRPVRLEAIALLPDAPPSLLRAGRTTWRVARAEGPERIEPEWWRDHDRPARDYYRIELTTGARLWVCRSGLPDADQPPRWWLHGHLP